MRKLLLILLSVYSLTAYSQSQPTSSKTRFVNGIYLGTKLDSYFNAADSNAIYWRADSVLRAKYKGTARTIAFVGDPASGYVPYTGAVDNVNLGNFRLTARSTALDTIRARSSAGVALYGNGSTQVALFGAGGGAGTTLYGGLVGTTFNFSSDGTVNALTVGRGAGNSNQNAAYGVDVMLSNTTGVGLSAYGNLALRANIDGTDNSAFGTTSLRLNTSGTQNSAFGAFALRSITTGSFNTGVGWNAGSFLADGTTANATGSQGIYIGRNSRASANGLTNEIVIGSAAVGNGSNTVTIGNSSVTDNYFTGNVRGGAFIRSGGTSTQYLMADGSVKDSTYVTVNGTQTINGAKTFNQNVITQSQTENLFIANGNTFSGLRLSKSGVSRWAIFNNNAVAGSDFFDIYNYITASSSLTINPSNNNVAMIGALNVTGNITSASVYTATVGGTNRDVFVDNTGLLGYVSSFRASKKNIKPLYATDWIHKLNPVTFNYRVKDSLGNYTDSAYKELEYGLIAEEVEPINKEMVFYDVDSSGNKKLRGVHYSKLIIPLLAEVQEHKKRIDAQDKIIEALLTRIKALEAKLN